MSVSKKSLGADGLLLAAAIIWGFAFSAQRSGMEFIGPFAYNGVRYALGALVLLPLIAYRRRRPGAAGELSPRPAGVLRGWRKAGGIALAGVVLFAGSVLQQLGLVSTTAGNAGFITSLYVVLVPIIALVFGKRSHLSIWAGAALAVAGLYVLSVAGSLRIAPGDLLVLAGSFFWALHILVLSKLAARIDPIELSAGQFTVCAVLSLASAVAAEPSPFAGVIPAAIPILYGGVMSCGVAFTFQILGQRTAHPGSASIIMSLESLFAGLGGVLILGEPLTARLAIGGALMLAGAIVSQLEPRAAERAS